jgi:hypothetical protein
LGGSDVRPGSDLHSNNAAKPAYEAARQESERRELVDKSCAVGCFDKREPQQNQEHHGEENRDRSILPLYVSVRSGADGSRDLLHGVSTLRVLHQLPPLYKSEYKRNGRSYKSHKKQVLDQANSSPGTKFGRHIRPIYYITKS